jgi:hypothetical protein
VRGWWILVVELRAIEVAWLAMLPARKRILIVGCLLAAGACLIVWLARRESATEKEIKRQLSALRAAGEPTTAQDLARMFPDPPPEEDASLLFGPVFNIVTNTRSRPDNPVSLASWIPRRTNRLEPGALASLSAFVDATLQVTSVWPRVIPEGTRFPTKWERGVTNRLFMDFLAARETTHLCVAHAVCAAEQGKADTAAEILAMGFQLTSSMNPDATLLEHMIRHAAEARLCQTVEQCLSRTSFRAPALVRLSDSIALERDRVWSDHLRVEHCIGLWSFEHIQSGGKIEDITGADREPLWKRMVQWFNFDGKRRVFYSDADYLFYVRTIPERLRISGLPASQLLTAFHRDRQHYASNVVSEWGFAVYTLGPQSVRSHVEGSTRLVVLKTALAVEQYVAVNPNKELKGLNDLVPALLPSVPLDPFDNKPLRYKKLPRGYVVYSIGADGVDNGGLERTNSSMTTNYDVTFTVER